MCQTSQTETARELRLIRVILERIECSFARQEAKLDKLLNSQMSPCLQPPVSQVQQQHFSTSAPNTNLRQSTLSDVEIFIRDQNTSGKYFTVSRFIQSNMLTTEATQNSDFVSMTSGSSSFVRPAFFSLAGIRPLTESYLSAL